MILLRWISRCKSWGRSPMCRPTCSDDEHSINQASQVLYAAYLKHRSIVWFQESFLAAPCIVKRRIRPPSTVHGNCDRPTGSSQAVSKGLKIVLKQSTAHLPFQF